MPKSRQPDREGTQGQETKPLWGIFPRRTRKLEAVRPTIPLPTPQKDEQARERRDVPDQRITILQPPDYVIKLSQASERLAPATQLTKEKGLRTQVLQQLDTLIQANIPSGHVSDSLPILSTTEAPTHYMKGLGRVLIDESEEAEITGHPMVEKTPGGQILTTIRASIRTNAERHQFLQSPAEVKRLIAAVAIFIAPPYAKYGHLPDDPSEHERHTIDQLIQIIHGKTSKPTQQSGKPEDFLL